MTKFGKYVSKDRVTLFKMLGAGGIYELKAMGQAFGHDDPTDVSDVCEYEAIEMLTDVLLDDILHATDDEIERVMKKLRDDAYMML